MVLFVDGAATCRILCLTKCLWTTFAAMALQYARMGCFVAITGRRQGMLADTAKQCRQLGAKDVLGTLR